MRKLIAVLFIIPSVLLGAYTEFYCDATNGANINGGSSTATSVYTSTNGNWNGTSTFTPTDGSNPATASPACTVNDFASVYLDGATTAVYIARITSVTNATNGAIGLSTTAKAGSAPTSGATGRSIKCGGVWKGPNGSSNFPFALLSFGSATDSNGDQPRLNLKNNASYALTAAISWNQATMTIQGYSSTVGDKGKALITSNATTGSAAFQITGGQSMSYIDIIWESTAGSGTNQVCNFNGSGGYYLRNVFRGGRNEGLVVNAPSQTYYACEFYGNNVANTSLHAAVTLSNGPASFVNCYFHDNAGSNTDGVRITASSAFFTSCVFDTNGASGIINNTSSSGGVAQCYNCDFYNNGADGYKYGSASAQGFINIVNCNFFKNAGKGINITVAAQSGYAKKNVYGAGTQANGSADTLGSVVSEDSTTYSSNNTPWASQATGNFTLTGTTLFNAGYFPFEENDGTNTGTIGYPDIGAANHNDTCGGTGPCQTSSGSAQ